ncbi:hypothetical protein QJS66_16535 [Kocuria rhizophila]|nr:hypothetical protein QJS66_16535 [Kocuria rhizophila]
MTHPLTEGEKCVDGHTGGLYSERAVADYYRRQRTEFILRSIWPVEPDTPSTEQTTTADQAATTAEQQHFDHLISEDSRVREPRDWDARGLPEGLTRQVSQRALRDHRHAGRKQTGSPAPRASSAGRADGQGPGRGGPGLYLYSAAETLGTPRSVLNEQLLSGKASCCLDLSTTRPARGRRRVRSAGSWTAPPSANRSRCAAPPIGRTAARWCASARRVLPPAPGLGDPLRALPRHRGPEADGAAPSTASTALPCRCWPPGRRLPNSQQSMEWNIKRFSSELRQRFVDMIVPQAEALA